MLYFAKKNYCVNGICSAFVCECYSGWQGTNCTVQIIPTTTNIPTTTSGTTTSPTPSPIPTCSVGVYHHNKHSSTMDYTIYWTLNTTSNTISIALEGKTTGWLGVAIYRNYTSPMIGAEAVIGWVRDSDRSPSVNAYVLQGRNESNIIIDPNVYLQNIQA